MNIDLNSKELSYSGRIDMENPARPEFIFPASSLRFSFIGRSAKITVSNRHGYWKNVLGAIVDGVQKRYDLWDEKVTEILLLDEAAEG